MFTEEIIRVLRIVEYVGPRSRVEDTVARSIHGVRDSGRGLSISAVTIGCYPEIIEKAKEIPEMSIKDFWPED